MNQRLLHTPEGVRDIYNDECEKKQALQERLRQVLHSYGYRDIETPTFEYFDVFSREVGTIPSKELYKFFDREGNTLVLRPDFTPSIARAASKYFLEETAPIRLCYLGNTFINNSSYQGRPKEATQLGAELIGDASVQADAEIIAMVVRSLLRAGLKEFQISIGHVGFFKALAREAGLDEAAEEELKELITNKNAFGAEKLLDSMSIPEEQKALFARLTNLFGSVEVLEKVKAMTKNSKALSALARLEELWQILTYYGVEEYVSFDLGMLSRYTYYTGIIFRGYTYGTGDAIVKGGRYDSLLGHFGKDAPAIGFVALADELIHALDRQKIAIPMAEKPVEITYTAAETETAVCRAEKLRAEGKAVSLRITGEED